MRGKIANVSEYYQKVGVVLKSYTVVVFFLPFMHYFAFYEANRWIDFVVYILKV